MLRARELLVVTRDMCPRVARGLGLLPLVVPRLFSSCNIDADRPSVRVTQIIQRTQQPRATLWVSFSNHTALFILSAPFTAVLREVVALV